MVTIERTAARKRRACSEIKKRWYKFWDVADMSLAALYSAGYVRDSLLKV